MPFLRFDDDPERAQVNLFTATALDAGAYLHPWHNWFLSSAHDDDAVVRSSWPPNGVSPPSPEAGCR